MLSAALATGQEVIGYFFIAVAVCVVLTIAFIAALLRQGLREEGRPYRWWPVLLLGLLAGLSGWVVAGFLYPIWMPLLQ